MNIVRNRRRSIKADTFNADRHRQLYDRRRNRANDVIYLVNQQTDYYDKLQVLFDELVPSTGQSKNMAGELTRAMMRILHRWQNDGDKFYVGYGIETCGSPAQMLYDEVPGVSTLIKDKLEDRYSPEDREYGRLLEDMTETTVNYIISNPSLFKQKSLDMFSYEPVDIETFEPEYEYEIDISSETNPYINMGVIDSDDVYNFIDGLTSNYGGEVEERYANTYVVTGLSQQEYDEWESQFPNELESWTNDLAEEYSDDDDEEYDSSMF